MKRKAIRGVVVSIIFCLVVGGFSSVVADVPNPLVTGPIPVAVPLGDLSRDYPQMATQLDPASHGYVEEEYFLEGFATRYDVPKVAAGVPPSMLPADVASTGHPYKTRMIFRRPISAKDFNGTVIMEWLNVTSGYNLDAMWLTSYAHMLREGYAYVGVSVQRVGIHAAGSGLREWSPVRYGSLDVTRAIPRILNPLIGPRRPEAEMHKRGSYFFASPKLVVPLPTRHEPGKPDQKRPKRAALNWGAGAGRSISSRFP